VGRSAALPAVTVCDMPLCGSSKTRRVAIGQLIMTMACLLQLASVPVAHAQDGFAVIANARPPQAEEMRLRALSASELLDVLNDNLSGRQISIAQCAMVWQHDVDAQTIRTRVDSRFVVEGDHEIYRGSLLYHPRTAGDMSEFARDGNRPPTRGSWTSLRVRDDSPRRYWLVKFAFEALAMQVAGNCDR